MPTKVLGDIRAIVSGLIQDAVGNLNGTARVQSIRSALRLHSQNVPAIKFQYVTGASNDTVRTPTGWSDEVSQIVAVEFPVNERPPTFLEEEDFMVIQTPTASTAFRILFMNNTPTASQRVGVKFSAPHFMGGTAAQNTVPDPHVEAIANLAASICCMQLSAFYSQQGDNTIEADSVNQQQKNPNYLQLAKVFESFYTKFFKIDEKGYARPASINVDIDRQSQGWGDFFYHSRRNR